MSKKIIVADDEPSLRLLVKATLASRKYTLIEVDNGQDALNLCREMKPDLVLLDVQMPHLTGFQVCSELKKSSETAGIPIIILTAKGGQSDKDLAVSLQANHFMTKPFRPSELLLVIDKIFAEISVLKS